RWRATGKPQLVRQPDTLDFAGRSLGDVLDDDDLARDLEVCNAPGGELTNIVRCCGRIWPQYDRRRDILTERGMRNGECHGLCHRGMLQEHGLDLLRRDLLPSPI